MMAAPLGTDIASRLSDCYRRQIGWIEDAIVALDALLAGPMPPDYDRWTAEDSVRARRLRELEAEFDALMKEWNATPGIQGGARQAVRELASRAERLKAEFDVRLRKVVALLGERADAIRGEAGGLRRALDNARKFSSGDARSGNFVDRSA